MYLSLRITIMAMRITLHRVDLNMPWWTLEGISSFDSMIRSQKVVLVGEDFVTFAPGDAFPKHDKQ